MSLLTLREQIKVCVSLQVPIASARFLAFSGSSPGFSCGVTDVYGAGICSEGGRPPLYHLCFFAVRGHLSLFVSMGARILRHTFGSMTLGS